MNVYKVALKLLFLAHLHFADHTDLDAYELQMFILYVCA